MFESLSDKINETFRVLKGKGTITESNLEEALRTIRIAFLEADVALSATKEFVEKIRNKAIGQTVIKSVSPAQMVIKIVNDELVEFLGSKNHEINFNKKPPLTILMAGLQGSGKTTTTAKLAYRLKNKFKKSVLVASFDVYRPAAREQLESLAKKNDIDSLEIINDEKPNQIISRAEQKAKNENYDVLLLDSAGRNHVDTKMMNELIDITRKIPITETLLVVDSMSGQDAANVAKHFSDKIDITGIVLSRLDGDARGGAALSMKSITKKPIKFIGIGEKIEELDEFHPDRIASRILGMGDVVTLVEKAAEDIDEKEAKHLQKKIMKGRFSLIDYSKQLDQISKLGGIQGLLKYLPGLSNLKSNVNDSVENNRIVEIQKAMINSMTKKERVFPDIIKASRKIRIAKGSGTRVQDVNKLLKQFKKMSQMMKKFGKNKNMDQMMNSQQFKNLGSLINK